MLDEALDLCGVQAFRVALERVLLGLASGPQRGRPVAEGGDLRTHRERFDPLPWRQLEACILGHSLLWRSGRSVDADVLLTARASYTVAQVCWRLANDRKVRGYVQGERVDGQIGLSPPEQIPGDGFELSDHAMAVVATTLVGDGVRDALRRLQMTPATSWHSLSPARILWAIYTSPEGPGLVPRSRTVQQLFDGTAPPIPIGRRRATLPMVHAYNEAARQALAGRVEKVVLSWCAGDPEAIAPGEVTARSLHWAQAALTQIHIWLGSTDRPAHGHADTPW